MTLSLTIPMNTNDWIKYKEELIAYLEWDVLLEDHERSAIQSEINRAAAMVKRLNTYKFSK
jgi:hypothetical protein